MRSLNCLGCQSREGPACGRHLHQARAARICSGGRRFKRPLSTPWLSLLQTGASACTGRRPASRQADWPNSSAPHTPIKGTLSRRGGSDRVAPLVRYKGLTDELLKRVAEAQNGAEATHPSRIFRMQPVRSASELSPRWCAASRKSVDG